MSTCFCLHIITILNKTTKSNKYQHGEPFIYSKKIFESAIKIPVLIKVKSWMFWETCCVDEG